MRKWEKRSNKAVRKGVRRCGLERCATCGNSIMLNTAGVFDCKSSVTTDKLQSYQSEQKTNSSVTTEIHQSISCYATWLRRNICIIE